MSDHKPAGESWESFTERRIREAQDTGAFDALPGFGQPIPGIDQPLEENWGIRRKLREEQLSVVPPVLEARLQREQFLDSLNSVPSESCLRRRVRELNQIIRKAQQSPIPGPVDGVMLLDEQTVLTKWKNVRAATTGERSGHGC